MRIARIAMEGFRCYKERTEISLCELAALVGKNDAGKSSILQALDIFFNGKPELLDMTIGLGADGAISIEVSFTDLPEAVELEDNVPTRLSSENLLDRDGLLTIRKTYSADKLAKSTKVKPSVSLIADDYAEDEFSNLSSRKETALNKLGDAHGLDFRKSGAGITNKSKREALRDVADKLGIAKSERELEGAEEVAKKLERYLPDFILFPADYRLSEEETAFQKEFKPLVETVVNEIAEKDRLEEGVKARLNEEVQKIHGFLKQHTDEVASMRPVPEFNWKDLVRFRLECTDAQGQCIPLRKRGAGLRRLVMVAYFEYLAECRRQGRQIAGGVYAIEEPETYLHPGAQRALLDSFREITGLDQVMFSSHSPVFAGSTPLEAIALVSRCDGVATISQGDQLSILALAHELGVEPSDQIFGYKACVFVEGEGDIMFLNKASEILKAAGRINETLQEANIGIISLGGQDSLKNWIGRDALRRLNRRFGVLIDSDRTSGDEKIHQKKLDWQAECEKQGATFFITRKREIENYLHPEAVKQVCAGRCVEFNDFTYMKDFNKEVINAIGLMTADQLLERDKYMDNGAERHEMLEIVESFLQLPGQSS